MDAALRPMTTSQVLDRTFQLYRSNFVLFAGIAIVAPALTLLAGFLQLRAFGIPAMPQPGEFDPTLLQRIVLQGIVGLVLTVIFYAVGQAFATGATMHAVSMVHLGKTTTIQESYRIIKPMFWRILGIFSAVLLRSFWPLILGYAMIFALFFAVSTFTRGGGDGQLGLALLVMGGFLLASVGILGGLVWGIYAYARYSLAVPAGVLEKLTVKNALARSKFLTRGSLGRIIAVYLLTLLMGIILTTLLQAPAYIGTNIFSMRPGAHLGASFLFWTYFGSFVGKALAGPVATIAIALIYYDERVRKEAFDLHLMMEALGQTSVGQPWVSAGSA